MFDLIVYKNFNRSIEIISVAVQTTDWWLSNKKQTWVIMEQEINLYNIIIY